MVKEEGEVLPPIVSTDIVFDTNLFIKWPMLMCADGSMAPLVFILQWSSMPPELFVWLEIPGLTNTTLATTSGYLMITHSRCGNYASWRFLFSKFVLPHIKAHQDILGLAESNLNMDGEAVILTAVMENPPPPPHTDHDAMVPVDPPAAQRTVIDEANDQNLSIAKLGAGRSIREQAADKCKGGFRGVKSTLRKIARDDIDTENKPLQGRILRAFETITSTPGCEDAVLPLTDKVKYADGVCTLIYAMKNSDALRPETLAQAFVLIGQHAKRIGEVGYEPPEYEVVGLEDPSVNVGLLITNNMVDNTQEERNLMIAAIPEARQMFRADGTLTRGQMDHLRIPRLPDDEPPRDGMQIWRQGGVNLNHGETMGRLAVFREARRPLTEQEKADQAAAAEQVKRLLEAQKLLEAAEAGAEKKRRKKQESDAEKARFKALSAADQAAEKQARKEAAAEKKRVGAEEKARKQAEAAAIVANAGALQLAGAAAAMAGRGAGRGRGGGGRGGGGRGRARGQG